MSSNLPYNPQELPRELQKYYISATDQEINEMLQSIGKNSLSELFDHISSEVKFESTPDIGPSLEYYKLKAHLENIAEKNTPKISFIGDGLMNYKVQPIVPFVSSIRGLTTAYTPYQPERSQGTLHTLWLYSSALSMLTGFEAINASLYDRSTALYEALQTATRIKKKKNMVLIAENFYPGDKEVIETMAQDTDLNYLWIPINTKTGLIDTEALKNLFEDHKDNVAAIAFPQVNNLGLLENVHELTDLAHNESALVIADVDPMLLATEGLIPPIKFGKNGADIIVGEGQHLAIGPNFGGPGVGIFGIRFNEHNKTNIRSTPGRFIGKAKDSEGRDCFSMILSTREQHIRREKATSNICSNQSFLATLVGASILNRGEEGMKQSCKSGYTQAREFLEKVTTLQGVELAFANTAFYNQVCLRVSKSPSELIEQACLQGIHLGVDVSKRVSENENLLLLSFTDIHTKEDINNLIQFFKDQFNNGKNATSSLSVPENLLRKEAVGLPQFTLEQLQDFYTQLGQQNVSPDDAIYPLGSCTMKYNPYINDYAASLPGFTDMHPQAPLQDAQGCLEILYETQNQFKAITGLPGLTTQPVAGAQGELVGLKLFQAYHRDRGDDKRNLIIIPQSAHGTNPATATVAGYNITSLKSLPNGEMDIENLKEILTQKGDEIAGIMVTNPNTSGVFEKNFKLMSHLIHKAGGLVYMDGANMNAIASWVDLGKLGVDAVHNNLHKTWTIPHGGGGPGDAIVAVSEKLLDFLPGHQVIKTDQGYTLEKPKKSIGSIHRHFGNFAHKVRCYTYIKALGSEGVRQMSAVAVLSANYLYEKLSKLFPTLPAGACEEPRMHEFILTLSQEQFKKIEDSGTPKPQIIAKIGKLFLDFGLHAPTVAFPEQYGLMIEPTESFTKKELDRFIDIVSGIKHVIDEGPHLLKTTPHFTPVRKVDEVSANKNIIIHEKISELADVPKDRIHPGQLSKLNVEEIIEKMSKVD